MKEIFTLRVAVLINFGWVTIASILGVAVCFKKFKTHFSNEEVWAIVILCVALVIFTVNSVLYGDFLYGGVFVYTMICLFAMYKKNIDHASKSEVFLIGSYSFGH